jgi:hypothetical protein
VLIVCEGLQTFKRQVAALKLPLIVLFEQQRAHEPCYGPLVGKDAHDLNVNPQFSFTHTCADAWFPLHEKRAAVFGGPLHTAITPSPACREHWKMMQAWPTTAANCGITLPIHAAASP